MTTPNTPPLRRRPSSAAVRLARPVLAAGCIWIATTRALAADGRVVGRVSDAATQAALPGAEVTVAGSSARAVTGPDGSFTLSLPPGEYQLSSYYLGYPAQTIPVVVADGASVPAKFTLGSSEVVTLETFTVEGSREGQARALNQQRTSQNLVNIVSADLAGQFPDKTIADAVKRLPGVTVETDTDTGGSEGRYISIRGLNADFNAVSINGVRAAVSDFSGLSRRVPLDVVSAKSADQIVVTKALRPDQDGDGIGGAVDITTRSPFDREGYYLTLEGAIGYSALADDYSSSYPHNDPSTEFSAAFSSPVGTEGKQGIALSVNFRDRAFVKQRVSTTGWRTDVDTGAYRPLGIALQHFYDDVTARGLTGTYEWRPSNDVRFRLDASYSDRETERGRDRQVVNYGTPDAAGAVIEGDTFVRFTNSTGTSGATRRIERNVRQFFEEQGLLNATLRGDITAGAWTFTPLLGVNLGTFDGDPDRDVSARFRSSRGTLTYSANGYLPGFSTTAPRNDPANYFLNSLDRGTSSVEDLGLTGALDAEREATFLGGEGSWKFGLKTNAFEREYDKTENYFFRNSVDIPDIYADQALAGYGPERTLDGAYDYGFFIDPDQVRDIANTPGTLDEPAVDNRLRGLANSYEATEDVNAGFAQGEFTWGQLTALAGARVELTRVEFSGHSGTTNGIGDVVSVTPYTASNDYVDVLPGLHLRYEQTKNLIYRFAVTRSLARPRLSDLNPGTFQDNDLLEITRGDVDLEPTRSTNFDLGAEYYFARAGVLSAGLFYKDMSDNVYTTRSFITGGPLDGYTVVSRANAKGASVQGFELGYDQQFTFLPAPFDGLGAFVNYTFADSEVDTGLAQFANVDLPLFNQVENTVNAGLFYEKGGFRTRVSLLYRSESLTELSTDVTTNDYDPKLSRYLAPTTTLDITASYRFLKHWQVFTEFSNVLDEAGKAYDGTEARMDYNEITDWTALVGLRWNL